MKNLNPREMRLVLIIVALLLSLGTFSVVKNQLNTLKALSVKQDEIERLKQFQEQALVTEPQRLKELERIRAQLPSHPQGKDLTPNITQQVRALARSAGMSLPSVNPNSEENLANINLYRTALKCSWNAEPEELIAFLWQLQQRGAVMDVRELDFRENRRNTGELAGTLVVEFVYRREPGGS